jgi:hypothetical protein
MKIAEKIKNKKGIAAAIIALMVIVTAGTIALLSHVTQAANNNFQGAVVNIGVYESGTLLENGNNTKAYNTMTAAGIDKEVQIKNINSTDYPTSDTYVRVRLVPKLVYNDGTEYAGQTVASDMTGMVDYTFGDTAGWSEQQTGDETYYYYTKALAPDEISSDLITHVTYKGEIPADTHFELQVLTEGIAAGQHTTTDAAGNVITADYAAAWNNVQAGAISQ